MLLNPHDWSLAQQIDRVLPALPPELAGARHRRRRTGRRSSWRTGVHETVGLTRPTSCAACAPRSRSELATLGLRAASAGTHPFTVWHETVVSAGEPLQARLRVDARAGPARADLRAARPCRRPRPGGRHPLADRMRGAPAAAAGAVGELAVLAGARHRPGIGSHAALPGIPARRASRARSTTTRTTSRSSTCWSGATRSPSRRSCGGTYGRSRASEPSRCGSWTRRRRWPIRRRSSRSSSRSRGSSARKGTRASSSRRAGGAGREPLRGGA